MKQTENYTIRNYGKKSTFGSFLPGISGIRGIPIWCYYVNRGQGVVSFGVDNKDHAIMEFYPAHQAYQNVKTTGFRTFLKKDGTVWEAFSDENAEHSMQITMNGLTIEEQNTAAGLRTKVTYFTLPGEKLGALVRVAEVKNTAESSINLEMLDGMPALIPYGVDLNSMKTMGQTAKAWMQVEDVESCLPYFRVRASMDDTAAVRQIRGGNFTACSLADGKLLKPIVDPKLVFGYDTSLRYAAGLKENTLASLFEREQAAANQLPCSFYGVEKKLAPGESITLYELIGQVEKKESLKDFFAERKQSAYFEAKKAEADKLVLELCGCIGTKTASAEFDAYCKYTYMDNVLRGGYPMRLGSLQKEMKEELKAFTSKAFTPGALCRKLDELSKDCRNESLFLQIIDLSDSLVNGNFGEGYWSDYWTYNLDLITDYLEIFPEKEREMLYEDGYTSFLSQVKVNCRTRRYAETENGLRQYYSLDEKSRRAQAEEKLVRSAYGAGEVLTMTLFEKLLLCTVKFAALDAYGMGIEMEGGKRKAGMVRCLKWPPGNVRFLHGGNL